jgi:hypothetical protein
MPLYKFIGCEIIYREACFLAATVPNRVDVEFMRKGLHDLETGTMVAHLQAAIDGVDLTLGYEAILLGYARCNDGLVGIESRNLPLVIPRAHDCITFFFGSRQAYQEYFDTKPGTFFSTSGWVEREVGESQYSHPAYGQQGVMDKLGLSQDYDALVEQYGEENAKYIAELTGGWQKNYERYLYLTTGICEEEPFIEATRQRAEEKGLDFELRNGNLTLLRNLFLGQWDDNYLVVEPGQRIVARNDESVLDVESI